MKVVFKVSAPGQDIYFELSKNPVSLGRGEDADIRSEALAAQDFNAVFSRPKLIMAAGPTTASTKLRSYPTHSSQSFNDNERMSLLFKESLISNESDENNTQRPRDQELSLHGVSESGF